jgi:hypothetical protein
VSPNYVVRYKEVVGVVVGADSPTAAAEWAHEKGLELESVRPWSGDAETILTTCASCAFCHRPQLAGIGGLVDHDWVEVPEYLQDIPFGMEVACPRCAREKGLSHG